MVKHLLTLSELSKSDFEVFFERALELKKRQKQGTANRSLVGKTLGLLFDKPSTRTRASFEAAMVQLGGTPLFISSKDTQMSRDEPIKDTARVLSGYFDGLAIRTFDQSTIEEFARHATIPVINALTDAYHPCQILSDLLTVLQKKRTLENLKIAWVGDGNNMAHSWINAAAELGLNLTLACPQDYFPDQNLLDQAHKKNPDNIKVTTDAVEAVENADVINTDVWASMGQEGEQESRKAVFEPFQVNAALVAHAKKDVIVMHCLPAHREEEITEEVLEGPNSVVWDQSENKLHMHKAILDILLSQ
ncbi:MAG: ornithine carbamoyltransferase [Deltaproteobacteria bacterium]|jgi:ornithine carbamoyltransferase|nr:ornithine carbamoyltransferase [Deltaproteobacteria bacterium]